MTLCLDCSGGCGEAPSFGNPQLLCRILPIQGLGKQAFGSTTPFWTPPVPPSPSLFVPHLMYSSKRLTENKGGSLGNRGLL